ncbi:hypothetical protein CLU79DRAFT_849896 [Phycomyces nitens]|nr:hypothetical protein CLU79DRAFT_849896 [Phycomyces nitens]
MLINLMKYPARDFRCNQGFGENRGSNPKASYKYGSLDASFDQHQLQSFSYPDKSTIEAKKDIPSVARDLSHHASAYDSVGADGNCGFRAVSFGVHKDQCKWMDVKGDMLKMYMRYKDTLYKAIGTDAVVQYEEERMINRLQSSKSPCLGQTDLSLWLSTFICTQIVADTYQRPVIIYTYSEHSVRTMGKLNVYHESQVYWPLIHMELTSADNLITLLLSFSYFYYIELQCTPVMTV